jgi:hypothetical protein
MTQYQSQPNTAQATAWAPPDPNTILNPAMTVDFSDFVGKFENAFTADYCESAIRYFDSMNRIGFGTHTDRLSGFPAHMKDKMSFNTSRAVAAGVDELGIVGVPSMQNHFLDVVWACYRIYTEKFSALDTPAPQGIYEIKIAKTEIGGGFHVWHWEQDQRTNCSRIMNVQLFLNDVVAGGETEFLYYPRIEPAKQGTLLIYPGNYTHTHRGNPPRSGAKYLVNGWIEF